MRAAFAGRSGSSCSAPDASSRPLRGSKRISSPGWSEWCPVATPKNSGEPGTARAWMSVVGNQELPPYTARWPVPSAFMANSGCGYICERSLYSQRV